MWAGFSIGKWAGFAEPGRRAGCDQAGGHRTERSLPDSQRSCLRALQVPGARGR